MKFFISILTLLFVCSFAKADQANKNGLYVGVESSVTTDGAFDEGLGKQAARGVTPILGYSHHVAGGYSVVVSTNRFPFNNGYDVYLGGGKHSAKLYRDAVGISKELKCFDDLCVNAGASVFRAQSYLDNVKTGEYNAMALSASINKGRYAYMLSYAPKKLASKGGNPPNTITLAVAIKVGE